MLQVVDTPDRAQARSTGRLTLDIACDGLVSGTFTFKQVMTIDLSPGSDALLGDIETLCPNATLDLADIFDLPWPLSSLVECCLLRLQLGADVDVGVDGPIRVRNDRLELIPTTYARVRAGFLGGPVVGTGTASAGFAVKSRARCCPWLSVLSVAGFTRTGRVDRTVMGPGVSGSYAVTARAASALMVGHPVGRQINSQDTSGQS